MSEQMQSACGCDDARTCQHAGWHKAWNALREIEGRITDPGDARMLVEAARRSSATWGRLLRESEHP